MTTDKLETETVNHALNALSIEQVLGVSAESIRQSEEYLRRLVLAGAQTELPSRRSGSLDRAEILSRLHLVAWISRRMTQAWRLLYPGRVGK